MKKLISILLLLTTLLSVCLLSSCKDNDAEPMNEPVLGEVDYSKIKFTVNTGSHLYGTVSPQNREEFIDYIVRHGTHWSACDYCDIYINFWSSSDIPAKDLFDIPFTGYKSYDDESEYAFFHRRYVTRGDTWVTIRPGVDVDLEVFANRIEQLTRNSEINDINFPYHIDHEDDN